MRIGSLLENGSITVPFRTLTSELACEVLAKARLRFTPEQVRVERREERWVVHLPANRLAWFAASEEDVGVLRSNAVCYNSSRTAVRLWHQGFSSKV